MPQRNISSDAVSRRLENLPEDIKGPIREISKGMILEKEPLRKYQVQFERLIRLIDALCSVGQVRDDEAKKYRSALNTIADPGRNWGMNDVRDYAKAIID